MRSTAGGGDGGPGVIRRDWIEMRENFGRDDYDGEEVEETERFEGDYTGTIGNRAVGGGYVIPMSS